MIDFLFCDGTWTGPGNRSAVAESVRRALDPSRVRFQYVEYAAAYGPATSPHHLSYSESLRLGMDALAAAVAASPYRAVVGGYSQGAAVAVRFARDRLPARRDLIVDAVATLGDPHQPAHHGRSGIAGALSVPRRRISLYVPGDPIADLPDGSPLRSVADLTKWMSIRTPDDVQRWALETLGDIADQRVQAWWQPWRWPDLASAAQYAGNYLYGTHHTLDYIRHGYALRLARAVEAIA